MGDQPKRVGAFRRGWLGTLAGLGALLFGTSAAQAIGCGEVLGPGGVAMLSDDLSCEESPALTVEGPVVVDLQGFTLRCALNHAGALAGTGIQVTGSQAEIRNGTIENCRRGVLVEGEGSHRLTHLTVTSAPGVGGGEPIAVLLTSNQNRIFRNIIRGYAGEAVRLDGANGNLLKYNRAIDNADHGFRVRVGERNLFYQNTARRNGGEGFRSQDRDNRIEFNTATDNGDEGIRLRDASAQNNLVIGNLVEHNGLSPCNPLADVPDVNPGIAVTRDANNNKIKDNKVTGNCAGIGIEEGSDKNKIVNNDVSKSKILDMVDGNAHCADNDWRKNKFKTSASGPFPPGIPFPPCIRFGNVFESVADQGGDVVRNGGSLAKDAGTAVKDVADSLF